MFFTPFLPCSADLAHWVSDVLEVYSHTTACPGFLIHLRFNLVS